MRTSLVQLLGWLHARWQTNFSLFGTYLREVANHWNEYVWDVLAPTSPLILWWMLGSPPMWIVALVFVWALLVAGYYTWRTDYLRLLPKIELTDFVVRPITTADANIRTVYLQLLPRCLTEQTVNQCLGHLRRIMVWRNPPGEWMPTEIDHPLELKWSFYGTQFRSLHPGTEDRLNLFYIAHIHDWIILETDPVPAVARSLLNFNDTFRFDVELTAYGCLPARISLVVRVGERWDTPTVTRV